jgi:hypothetical protein
MEDGDPISGVYSSTIITKIPEELPPGQLHHGLDFWGGSVLG